MTLSSLTHPGHVPKCGQFIAEDEEEVDEVDEEGGENGVVFDRYSSSSSSLR
jgi:hypothetical protein